MSRWPPYILGAIHAVTGTTLHVIFSESITTTQAKGSPFLTMRTEDVDGPAGPVKYSFSDFSFIGPRDNHTDVTPAPFTIEEETGVVRTTYDNYQKYANGYWTMTVNAKDDQAEQNIELRVGVLGFRMFFLPVQTFIFNVPESLCAREVTCLTSFLSPSS